MTEMIVPRQLDELSAAVIEPDYEGRMRWSNQTRGWHAARYGRGYAAKPLDPSDLGRSGQQMIEQVAQVASRADDLRRRGCYRCGQPQLADHFVAPDILGQPHLYCVQLPDPQVVSGGGTKKHWGTPHGCQAVSPHFFIERFPGGDEDETVTFGDPLVATLVRDLEWCSRCRGAAHNVASAAAEKGVGLDQYVRHAEELLLGTRAANRAARQGRR